MPRHHKEKLALIWLVIAVAGVSLLGLTKGAGIISSGEMLKALFGAEDRILEVIVWELRMPRLLLGLLVGATLGISGAALQAMFKNPLAEPGVIGVSSSAALGAVVVLYFGLAGINDYALPLAAIGMALVAMSLLIVVVMWEVSALTLILAGVALNSFMASLTALAINLSPNPFAFNDIMFWLMGSLANRSMDDFVLILPFVAFGWGLLFLAAKPLTTTVLSDEAAHSLGVNLRVTNILVIAGVAFGVGASIAVTGVIGFVGLVAPHLVRPVFGHDPKKLYVPSALAGALILVGADVLIRVLPNGGNLRIGVMTALLGAPFFAWYLIASRRAIR